jgi:peptidase MA superfamily protein
MRQMDRKDRPRRAGLLLGWFGALLAASSPVGAVFLPVAPAQAADVRRADSRGASRSRALPAKPNAATASWQILETANFRILSYGQQPVAAQVGRACERLRDELVARWHTANSVPAWTPKCDVVLHPNDASYLREIGAGGVTTVASSLVDYKNGTISVRRVDVRSHNSEWQSAALPHELTHVILADCFAGHVVPRWIDEGAALLADPTEKKLRHKAEMEQAIAARSAFRVVELLTLEDYPANNRWGAFYGQSLSLVEYLTQQRSTDEFIRFVQLSFDKGYDASLREVYGLGGVAELERHWKSKTALPAAVAVGQAERRGLTLAEVSFGGGTEIE